MIGSDRRRRKILCALDFSEHTTKTLHEGLAQAEKFDGELVVLHVLNERMFEELNRIQGRVQALGGELAEQAIQTLGDEREERLREILAEVHAERVPHTSIISRGYPFEEILRTAQELEVDLIVMGAKGRMSVPRQLRFGGQAEKVFRRAQCSVLFVR